MHLVFPFSKENNVNDYEIFLSTNIINVFNTPLVNRYKNIYHFICKRLYFPNLCSFCRE